MAVNPVERAKRFPYNSLSNFLKLDGSLTSCKDHPQSDVSTR
jgi:hypothetical protein